MSAGAATWEDIRTFPGDLVLALLNEGAHGAWKALASRSIRRVLRWGRSQILAVAFEDEIDVAPPEGISIRAAGQCDLAALASLVGQREARRLGLLLAHGAHALIAWRDGKPVGQVWWTERLGPKILPWPFPVSLPGRAVYFWNLYVLPRERNRGIAAALHSAGVREAQAAGFRERWGMVTPSNLASLNAARKGTRNLRLIGEVRFVQLFGRAYMRLVPEPLSQEIPCNCLTR